MVKKDSSKRKVPVLVAVAESSRFFIIQLAFSTHPLRRDRHFLLAAIGHICEFRLRSHLYTIIRYPEAAQFVLQAAAEIAKDSSLSDVVRDKTWHRVQMLLFEELNQVVWNL